MSQRQKILLVDDEVAVRNLYHLYFESHGYSVIAAASISEALRYLRDGDINIAIIDIFLHGENGLDLLRGLAAARPGFPIIIMSGIGSDQPQFREALGAGAKGIFSKTLPLSDLLREVHRILGSAPTLIEPT